MVGWPKEEYIRDVEEGEGKVGKSCFGEVDK